MKLSTSAGLFLILFVSITGMNAKSQNSKPVALEKVTGNIYQVINGKGSTGGAFIGENGVLVIDAKMNKESVDQTISAIEEITDKPIKYLVNTHSDGDHIMGNRYFPKSVTFVAHENCRDDFFKPNFGRESDWGKPEFLPFVPSVTFKDTINLWLGKDIIELYYFGVGHTTGDCVVYFPKEKVAFLGDQFFNDRPQLIHSNKNGNSFEHVKTLTKMLETIDAQQFCSGHSDIVGREAILNNIQLMKDRQNKVQELINNDKTIEDVLSEFNKNEARLIKSIFNEITAK